MLVNATNPCHYYYVCQVSKSPPMRLLVSVLAFLLCCTACNERTPASRAATPDEERQHPDDFLKVNFEVRRNLINKKVVEGEVVNTGKNLTYRSITLKIDCINKDGDHNPVNYTITEIVAPGGRASFRFKPDGSPDQIKVSVASASTE